MSETFLDALVVGAGFGGIYQLKKLKDQGLYVIAIDVASDVGGTWHWNRYPGAMSDTESYLYRYSWDQEDLKTYPWTKHYLYQPDILAYLRHVTEKHNLRQHMHFNTELISAVWDDSSSRWIVETSTGVTYKARYLITALGLLSRQNLPHFRGIDDYTGELYHTGSWPDNVNLKGKRVGVIGNGSTGVQVITAIAKDVKQLVCFQRNPQFSVPSGQGPATPEYRKSINNDYNKIWKDCKDSMFGFGFEEASRPTSSVSEEERIAIYEKAWNRGGGFRFMFETFGDITTDVDANNCATDFIKKKITATVNDPEKLQKLMPTQLYARRPLCDAGYYDQFNLPHVSIVSLKDTPIAHFTPTGITTSDGTPHDLDVVIFATGFDAVDGSYTRIRIQGRNGQTLKDHWSNSSGPTSYLGLTIPGFPNMFMILGPNGPFSNIPPAIEIQVDFISNMIADAEKTNGAGTGKGKTVIEATPQAEQDWTEMCDEMSKGSLFAKTDSWIFGANVEGKKRSVLFYFGGLKAYGDRLKDVVGHGYQGFTGL
ncbi:cyclohexanone monooxygenase [Ampelomyces quisqualis]|uniref:Cyclohexanone monooxygenase n=1 Tax=Ampelomyces quisqualis TaxID=50730 RepID=A0A6A5R0P2_AMPQU|nr:cyclohexanone monooxygenase [Ampelomyces quisqualis]